MIRLLSKNLLRNYLSNHIIPATNQIRCYSSALSQTADDVRKEQHEKTIKTEVRMSIGLLIFVQDLIVFFLIRFKFGMQWVVNVLIHNQ